MKICFLVVIYNKKMQDSTTINSLLEIKNNNFFCFIVNNGPVEIDFSGFEGSSNITFNFFEHLDNKPLSIIYNDFIRFYNDADRYVILDDDSILSESFIERVFNKDLSLFDLELPKVFDKHNKLYYPLKNWYPIEKDDIYLNYKDDIIFSIGSGLIISKNLVDFFKHKELNLFNEAFAFYGVDFSFFWELKKYDFGELKITSTAKLIHDMSLHGEISDFKRNELYVGFALQMRYYPSNVNLKNFLYSLYQSIKMKKLNIAIAMLKAYFFGKHPKC